MSNSETPTPTVASDWLVSVTPTPRGDWQLPGGVRFNMTLHNGATPDDVTAALATLAAISTALVSAYDTSIPTQATGSTATPPSAPARQAPPPPEGADVEDVYGVGMIQAGGQFDVEIERASATATKAGKPQLALYRPGNQYPFAHVNENQFDTFHGLTGVHGGDLRGETKFQAPVLMRFKVGKKKANSDKHYIDFVGAPGGQPASAPATPPTPPASNGGGQAWNRTAVIAALSEAYPKWEQAAINDALNRVNTTPDMTDAQVIEAFNAKVTAATSPKGA